LTIVDDLATSESISTETPDHDSQQVDAAGKGISVKSDEERASKSVTYERMTVPRKGSWRPARSKKSVPLVIAFKKLRRGLQLTCGIGADDSKTSKLLPNSKQHHGEGSLLQFI
jgi:hypothetical protein